MKLREVWLNVHHKKGTHMRRLIGAAVLLLFTATSAVAQTGMKMTIATGVDPSLAQFYVAQAGGIFKRNGLEVDLKIGSSGSAMVPLLINNQIQAALAAEQAGIQTHNLDPNVVIVGESMLGTRYQAIIGRDLANLNAMKGKRIGVALGTASEVFWQALLDKLKLDPKDYKIVNVEPPEMLAGLERRDIDVVSAWEPWTTRIIAGVPGTKVLTLNEGIFVIHDYVYINKGWAQANPAALKAFMLSMVEATNLLNNKPEEAAGYVASTLKLEPKFTAELMTRVDFVMRLNPGALEHMKIIERQIARSGKLTKPIDWTKIFWSEPLASVAPAKVEPLFK
jgi:ABC-type nitrate/sulfonate/bicarbonate transport system substrate-binding protein